MNDVERREAARQFYYKWQDRGREDEDARSYWIDILQNILGLDHVTDSCLTQPPKSKILSMNLETHSLSSVAWSMYFLPNLVKPCELKILP